jgi:hypothetical protein
MAGVVFLVWYERHLRNRAVRDHVIQEYGQDVPVQGAIYVDKAGQIVDPDPSDGDQSSEHTAANLLEPVEWLEGTEPVRCDRCGREMEHRQAEDHTC